MASLRTQQAARLLRTASSRPAQLTTRRYESSIVKARQPAHEQPLEPTQQGHNQPDYAVHIDKATSYALPLPLGLSSTERHTS